MYVCCVNEIFYILNELRYVRLLCECLFVADPSNVADSTDFFDRPAQELFIWAVLLNRQSLAKLFWREGNVSTNAFCIFLGRVFAHGAMGRRIDPSWGGPIELFLVPASAPRLV